jgi:UDP-glucuronate 4-epimerase
MKILVTGACGFIGFHLCKKLQELNYEVVGVDNFDPYYSVILKESRSKILRNLGVTIINMDLCDLKLKLPEVDIIVHLAGQAGIRHSIEHPEAYIKNNIVGFHNIIKFAKDIKVERFIYASTASVYGSNIAPLKEDMPFKGISSVYAASKVSDEILAESYLHMFELKSIGLRFFTVYGPWGRPDMAMWLWTDAILNKKLVDIYNYGKMERSWTYIDDIVSGIILSIGLNFSGHEIFNLGNDNIVNIDYAVDYISDYLGIKPKKNYLPLQLGDVKISSPDLTKSKKVLGFEPKIRFEDGVINFIDWFNEYKGKLK